MDYGEWERTVPTAITGDVLWRLRVYRLALYAADAGWIDLQRLGQDRRSRSLTDQLYRSLGSVSANIAEGYSRSTGRERARFYEYALGSARETRDWYYKVRHVLGPEVTEHRLALMTRIIQLLLVAIPDQRGRGIREEHAFYNVDD